MKRPGCGLSVVATACAWALPSFAYACPVCFAAQDEAQRIAFLGTTVFLTALPVLMIGGLIYWIASRSADESPEAESTTPEAADETRLGA